jgi:hypothetical protein
MMTIIIDLILNFYIKYVLKEATKKIDNLNEILLLSYFIELILNI